MRLTACGNPATAPLEAVQIIVVDDDAGDDADCFGYDGDGGDDDDHDDDDDDDES